MDETLLDRWRAQVGVSFLGWASGPGALTDAGDGWWLVLSGVPSADGNVGLVFADDPRSCGRSRAGSPAPGSRRC